MSRPEVPRARVGQSVTAAMWETMRAANRASRIIAGNNVRTREVSGGTIVDFTGVPADFVHPWMVTLQGSESATIRTGTINKIEAAIDGVPLSGLEGEAAPVLTFGQPDLDAEGRGFICAEVTCEPKDWSIKTIEIVQVADPDSEDGSPSDFPHMGGAAKALEGNRARHPLARLRAREGGRIELFQITFFDLQHRVALAADGRTAARHFFYT